MDRIASNASVYRVALAALLICCGCGEDKAPAQKSVVVPPSAGPPSSVVAPPATHPGQSVVLKSVENATPEAQLKPEEITKDRSATSTLEKPWQ